jgi:tol-pal system protein YbgF
MVKWKTLLAALAAVCMVASAVPSANAQLFGGGGGGDAQVRLNDMEEQMRRLNGQVEQLSYQLRELQDQLRRMQEDNEYRFQQLESAPKQPGKRSDAGPAAPVQQQATNNAATAGAGLAPAEGTLGQMAPGSNAAGNGSGDAEFAAGGGYQDGNYQENSASGAGPLDLSALARGQFGQSQGQSQGQNQSMVSGGTPPGVNSGANQLPGQPSGQIASLGMTGDPQTDYDTAYNFALQGDYVSAEQSFRSFLEAYPKSEQVPSAQYWLGESLYAQGEYRGAADAFLKTYTEHPKNTKAPDSLLKLGLSLNGLGETGAACATYAELLKKYPNAAKAVRDQARAEQQRARCS